MNIKRFSICWIGDREVVVINIVDNGLFVAPILSKEYNSPLCIRVKNGAFLHLELLFFVEEQELDKNTGKINSTVVTSVIQQLFGNCKNGGDHIECLCDNHVKKLQNSTVWMIRRIDPFDHHKSKCSRCQNFGYKYSITKKGK